MARFNTVSSCLGVCSIFFLSAHLGGQELNGPPELPDGLSRSDWTGIRGVYEAGRHSAFETDSGFQAHNPGQRWLATFDGRGLLVMPDAGTWSWGLQLDRYGFDGAMQSVGEVACASANVGRVEYDWDANVQEWYINDTRGLEHGYTIQSKPAQGPDKGAPLTMELSVQGTLRAELLPDSKGTRFVNPLGATVLTYAGLHVYDVEGTPQDAWFVVDGDHLRIQVQDAAAKYPLTIDPIAQQAYLKASNTGPGDGFGVSVAISGELVVVGAWLENSNAVGVNGNQNNNSSTDSGAVYIFERSGGVWSQQAYLKASNSDALDGFGISVAISGELVVVGARNEDGNAVGVNGNQSTNGAVNSGAAYIFGRNAGTWSQLAYLKASNTDPGDQFGSSVAISGELVVVGAYQEAGSSSGVNGNQSSNTFTRSGATYIFERNGAAWSQQAYLKASNPNSSDEFGRSVAVSGELVVVGAWFEASNATGINGSQFDNSAAQAGAAYIFERIDGSWSQQAYLKASNAEFGDNFGFPVAISGELVAIGAHGEASNSTGVNGNQSNNSAFSSGAVYIFERGGGVWSQQAYLKPSNTGATERFGHSADISGEIVVVGAWLEASDATGVNGDQSNNNSNNSGAAYTFERVGGIWRQQSFLKATNTGTHDHFGLSVAISGGLLVVGAPDEDSSATGVNGDQSSNNATNSGAAYVFDASTPIASYCGPAAPNSTGFPGVMNASGSFSVADNALTLRAEGLPVSVFGFFLNSMGHDFVAMPGGSQGTLCLGGGSAVGRHHDSLQLSSGTGMIESLLDLTNLPSSTLPVAVLAGDTWNFQCWYRDMNPGSTSNFTDAISVQFE